MRAQTVITIEPMPGNLTRLVVTSHVPGGRQPIQTTVEYTQDTVRGLVVDLCKKAGLPAPWKG